MTRRAFHRLASGGLIACLVALFGILGAPAFGKAAPQYRESEPPRGAHVDDAPSEVSVTFDEPLDDSSTMSVVNECGDRLDDRAVRVELDTMSVGLAERHYSGMYKVTYRAVGLGGVTGTTNGSFDFHVGGGHPCDEGGGGGGDHDGHGDDGKRDRHDHGRKKDHGNGSKDGHGDHGDRGHSGSNHDRMATHADHGGTATTDHSGHGMTGGADHEMHGGGKDHGRGHRGGDKGHGRHGGNGGDHGGHGSPNATLASDPVPATPADGRAVLIALALCAGMGIIGGVFLRTSIR